jgi:1,4-alpha-glucan branching enzyme
MDNKPKGYWSLVLHAHLPYVRHPEWDDFLEEDWFYEGMVETYIPLLSTFEKFMDEGIDFCYKRVVCGTSTILLN